MCDIYLDDYHIPFFLMRDIYRGKKKIKHISFTEEQLKRCMNDYGITKYEVHRVSQTACGRNRSLVAGVINITKKKK